MALPAAGGQSASVTARANCSRKKGFATALAMDLVAHGGGQRVPEQAARRRQRQWPEVKAGGAPLTQSRGQGDVQRS